MKPLNKLILSLGILFPLAGCSEDEPAPAPGEVVAITAQVTNNVVSRAGEDAPYTDEDAEIHLYYGAAGSTQKATYTYADDAWTVSGTPLYWDNLDADADGEYNFTATAPAGYVAGAGVEADQSTTAGYKQSDLLQAEAVSSRRNAVLALGFRHQFAQVAVNLNTGTGDDKLTPAELASATVSVRGLKISPAAGAQATDITPLNAGNNAFLLVCPPQQSAAEALEVAITMTVGGGQRSYTWKSTSAITLEEGKSTAVNLVVNRTEVMAGEITVKPWEDGGSTSGSAAGDDIVQNINISFIEASGVLQIATGDKTAVYDWKELDGQFKLTLQPASATIYWDDLDKYDASDNLAKHTFNLTFTPDAAGTPEKDILEGSATISWGAKLDANSLAHINAMFIVNLEKGDGFTKEEFDSAAKTIRVHGFTTEAYTFADTEAIVKPATLGEAHKVVATVAGHEYAVQLSGKFEKFQAGRKYTLGMVIHKDKLGVTIGKIEDWIKGTGGTGEFEY